MQRRFLTERAKLLAERVRTRHIVDGHGDLRPEHICLGDPVRIIDCLEFNARLSMVDPFDEIAFLCVECERLGAAWASEYLRAASCTRCTTATLRSFLSSIAAIAPRCSPVAGRIAQPSPRRTNGRRWRAAICTLPPQDAVRIKEISFVMRRRVTRASMLTRRDGQPAILRSSPAMTLLQGCNSTPAKSAPEGILPAVRLIRCGQAPSSKIRGADMNAGRARRSMVNMIPFNPPGFYTGALGI